MSDSKDKNCFEIKRIEVSSGVTIKRDKAWIRHELKETAEVHYDSVDSLCKAESVLFNHVKSRLQELVSQKSETPPTRPFQLDKIKLEPKQGKSGPFERSVDRRNPEFQNVVNALMTSREVLIDEWYVWLFKDNKTLGRKPRQM